MHPKLEHAGKRHAFFLDDSVVKPLHIDTDRRVVVDDTRRLNLRRLLHHASQGADQVPHLDLVNRLLGGIDSTRRKVVGQPRVLLLPLLTAFFEHAGRVFVLLVFEQTFDQLVAWVFDFLGVFFDLWQRHPGLDFNQQAGHFDEVAYGIDVHLLQDVQVLEVLVCDQSDGNIQHI